MVRIRKALNWLAYYRQFLPITIHGILLILGLIWIARNVPPLSADESIAGSDASLLWLMLKIAALLGLLLAALSLISTLVVWIYYLRALRRGKVIWSVYAEEDEKQGQPAPLRLILHKRLRPLLGAVRGRWVFDQLALSASFPLFGRKHTRAGRAYHLAELPALEWPDLQEYALQKAILQVQDLFRLVSLPLVLDFRQSYTPPPPRQESQTMSPPPRLQRESDQRVPWLRKAQGDYIQHKDFEAGDDIRRIAWKWYARNRELLVRIPEIQEPYASEIYIYASFYEDPKLAALPRPYNREMLNFYKTQIWTALEGIKASSARVHLLIDQPVEVPPSASALPADWGLITQASWQADPPPGSWVDTSKASLLLISSFVRPQDLEDLLEKGDGNLRILLIRLSETFPKARPWAKLLSLFLRPQGGRWKRLQAQWWYSPWRRRLRRREQQLTKILEAYDSQR